MSLTASRLHCILASRIPDPAQDAYEAAHMQYAESNRLISEFTVELFLRAYPRALHGLGR